MSARPAILVLDAAALPLARRAAAAVDGEVLAYAPRVAPAAVPVFDDIAARVVALFEAGRPIVGICAAAILIRALAPHLKDKRSEAPVLALAGDASSVVPLLGGHHGGNALARRLAEALGAHAAVTTASDLRLGVALDEPPLGWRLENPEAAKPVIAALLAGESVRIENETGIDAAWLAALQQADAARHRILISTRADARADLVYRPQILALGLGCERLLPPEEMSAFVRAELAAVNLSPLCLAGLFSIALKAAEPAIHALAEELGIPARFFAAARLEREAPRLRNPSATVFRETGCHGVAEGAALAAAGASGELILPKRRAARATLAVAQATQILEAEAIGQARGRLFILGIGPGDAGLRAPLVDRALAQVGDVVGYGLYLDLLGAAIDGKRRHDRALGEEEARCRLALDLAAEGRDVALVSSGDAGIYAMATLVHELVERGDRADWQRLMIETVPGISAMQAAAARIGAPLGHDFCAISLSDLLTPWPAIERRIAAAAAGDFVIAFYNPVSARRREQLAQARAILLRHRDAATPVVIARNLARAGESLTVTTLGDLAPDQVDMLAIVLVGSSATRAYRKPDGGAVVYTPRGYGDKAPAS